MTPFEYVYQYHRFVVYDPRMRLQFQASITGYNNKFSTDGSSEMGRVIGGLSRKYFQGRNLPKVFNIVNEPRIDPNQHFSQGSLNRVFQSRGSPYEFYHAVRLAFLAGQCNAQNAAAYCQKWFKNDCVSFAGAFDPWREPGGARVGAKPSR